MRMLLYQIARILLEQAKKGNSLSCTINRYNGEWKKIFNTIQNIKGSKQTTSIINIIN